MSSLRLIAASAVCLTTAGCGFQPLYGEGGASDALATRLASIRVAQISERFGQVMTNTLHDGLNPHAMQVPIAYQLEVALRETTGPYATRADGTPSRASLALSATWTLRNMTNNAVVTGGSTKASAGYDVLDNDYANVVSGNSGELRAVRDLSDQIETSVAVYLQAHPKT
jgi:LPS-assembly lipoprotein